MEVKWGYRIYVMRIEKAIGGREGTSQRGEEEKTVGEGTKYG